MQTRRLLPVSALLAIVAVVALVAGATVAQARKSASVSPNLQMDFRGSVTRGHPNAEESLLFSAMTTDSRAMAAQPNALPFDPPDSPLASGSFVNFESPPVKAVALSPNGARLYVANTPNNSLVIFETSPRLVKIGEIPVGLDPVSVVVRPGADGEEVWVANFISDSISVVDVGAMQVTDVIEVGDEPVNMLFDASGAHAFVVVQGTPTLHDTSPTAPTIEMQEGAIVSIDASTRDIIRSQFLDMHTPRAMAWSNGQIAVAAVHSGNDTTVVGQPALLESIDPLTGDPMGIIPTTGLALVQFFAGTAPIFADPSLSPWPDTSSVLGAPLVQRIVPDANEPGAWADIIDLLATPTGDPDPVVVAQLEAQLEALFNGTRDFTNVGDVVHEIIDDAKDAVDHDLVFVEVAGLLSPTGALTAPNMVSGVGTTLTAMAADPTNGRLLATNMEALNLTRLEPNLRGHFIDHEISFIDTNGAVSRTDLHANVPNYDDVTTVNPDAQAASLANPVDIVVSGDGQRAYVASLGTGRIGVLDATNGDVLGLADVGRGTRSLALDESGSRLYALNRTDMTITVVDVAGDSPVVVQTAPLFNPEPPIVRSGRDFLYSTRFSNNFSSSCAMCHTDARLDHLSWDLGDPGAGLQFTPHVVAAGQQDPCVVGGGENHPLKGPMFTLSLQGLRDHAPLHWRGDRIDFNAFNGAFDGLLGGSELSDEDMQAYTDFVNTIEYTPPPFRNRDNSYVNPTANTGRNVFITSCNPCHQLDHDGAMAFDCVTGDAGFNLNGGLFAQVQLTTQLRGFHKKLESDRLTGFGLIHDGREEREDNGTPLDTFIEEFFPGLIQFGLDDDLHAFMRSYPTNAMPVIGWQVEVEPLPSASAMADLDLMIVQSGLAPSRNDVVAKGLIAGEMRGYVLIDPTTETFQSDTDEVLTLAQLTASLTLGDRLIFTAVPPGSGERIGVNQDLDCLSDGLDPFPQRNPDVNLSGAVDGVDLATLLAAWGPNPGLIDLTEDGHVNGADLANLLASWGVCP